MKLNLFALALAGIVAASTQSAAAAVVNYSALVNLDPGMTESNGWTNVPLPGDPMGIQVGDTLIGTINFANNGRITVFNDPERNGREWILVNFWPNYATTAFSTGSFTLLGLTGDYRGAETIASDNNGGSLYAGSARDFTDTMFSFTGISFSITYTDKHTPEDYPLTSHVTPGYLTVFSPSSIWEGSAVPEPATWAMMIIGFGAAGASLRQRRMPFEWA